MKCPICKTWAKVLETRPAINNEKKRLYECDNLHRFSTLEKIPIKTNEQQIVSTRKIAPSKN